MGSSQPTALPFLLSAAAGVAVVHAMIPDHWAPLSIVARSSRWSIERTARVSLWAALGHVAASLGLGFALVALPPLRRMARAEEGHIIGLMLIATGLLLLLWLGLRGLRPRRSRGGRLRSPAARQGAVGQYVVPFGVAASPNLAIVPLALAADAHGPLALGLVLVCFTLATIVTFAALSVLGTIGSYQLEWPWLEAHGDLVSALLLVAIGLVAYAAL